MNVMTWYSKKKWTEKLLLLFAITFVFSACGDDDDSYTLGVWNRRSDFDGYFDYSVPPGGMQEQIHKIIECL